MLRLQLKKLWCRGLTGRRRLAEVFVGIMASKVDGAGRAAHDRAMEWLSTVVGGALVG